MGFVISKMPIRYASGDVKSGERNHISNKGEQSVWIQKWGS